MDKKYGEFIGVDKLHFAIITQDDELGYVTTTPEFLAPTAEISGEPELNNTPTYYDNKPGNNYVTEGVTTLNITVSNVDAQKMALLLGKRYDPVSGRVLDSGQPSPPSIAVGFRYNIGSSDYRYYWYLKGTFSGGAEEATSKSNDVDIKNYQLTFTAVSTTHEWTFNDDKESMKRIFGDTTDSTFNAAGWFNNVQTPDSISQPVPLSLASIVPADEATGIPRSSSIVLTFTNAVHTEQITLIDSTTGDVIDATKTWDAFGKVLTVKPAANLAASTKYLVIILGVKDVYGQALTPSSTEFTTAT